MASPIPTRAIRTADARPTVRDIATDTLDALFACDAVCRLSPVDRGFLTRVMSTQPTVYARRLETIGFCGLDEVLDAGCGFGQWTACLAEGNRSVTALDCAADRLAVAAEVFRLRGATNVRALVGSLIKLPFEDGAFDGVFSYSVIYLTDWRRAVSELCRCLRPGGLLYLNSNGLGWYLHNLLEDHNSGAGFSSRQMAIDALENTLTYYTRGKSIDGRCIVTPSSLVCDELRKHVMDVVAVGSDGSINLPGGPAPQSFYDREMHGHESVWEVLAQKRT